MSQREIEVLRRIQNGAFAHPEHEANPDYIAYFSSKPELFGLNTDRNLNKAAFQPSKRDAKMARKLLKALKEGKIDMDFLTGKKKSMQANKQMSDEVFQMWKGDEEDELANKKGPTHIAAPKMTPPGHAESYRPPGEYIPTEEELAAWEELDPEDRPYGHLVPKTFDNLRSVGAYENAVRDRYVCHTDSSPPPDTSPPMMITHPYHIPVQNTVDGPERGKIPNVEHIVPPT